MATMTTTTSVQFQDSTKNSYKLEQPLERIPGVRLVHPGGGGVFAQGLLSPTLSSSTSNARDEVLLIPLSRTSTTCADEESVGAPADQIAPSNTFDSDVTTQEYEEAHARSTHFILAHRASDGTLKYVSCRRDHNVGRSVAIYKKCVGSFEIFEIEYDAFSNSYAFKSHSGLYLNYNKHFRTIAFKNEKTASTQWNVSVPGLATKIAYLGVVDLGSDNTSDLRFLAQTVAPGLPFNQDHIRELTRMIGECHKKGTRWTTRFMIPNNENPRTQWIAKIDEDNICFLFVASPGYPMFVAFECIDDLQCLFNHHYKDQCTNGKEMTAPMQSRQSRELFATRMEYEDLEALWSSREHSLPQEVKARMQENFDNVIANIESAEAMNAKAEQLQQDAALLHRKATELRRSVKYGTVSVMALGAATGGILGWLVGGPAGTAVFATQGAEIAAGAALTAGVLGALKYTVDAKESFYKYTFVPLGKKQMQRMKKKGLGW